jgi:hypothetical protein
MLQISKPTFVEDLINNPDFNIDDYYGYVYLTTNMLTGEAYIGKKIFKNSTNKKLGKKEIAALPTKRGRVTSKKKIIIESNWKTYYGSSDEVKEWVKNVPKDKLLRVVLRLCKSSKELTYYETKYLFQYNVLEDNRYVNGNILGRFFPKDLK